MDFTLENCLNEGLKNLKSTLFIFIIQSHIWLTEIIIF